MNPNSLPKNCLEIDCASEVEKISNSLRALLKRYRRKGIVLGLSGGIDSSVTAALCVEAIGKRRVFGIHMPERESEDDTLMLSQVVSEHLGIDSVEENITPILEAFRCYERREAAVKTVIPEFDGSWKMKIVIESILENDGFNFSSVVAQSPSGKSIKKRLPTAAYLGIVAASNFKQRTRKAFEYFHADRLNYVVAGTPNRLEYDQGFFVKLGDGAADAKPIAHLYKTQVYQLAAYLGVPESIRQRPPTTDTYSLPQSQDEFYFSLPYEQMDVCLFAKNLGYSAAAVGDRIGFPEEVVSRVFKDIDRKRATTRYLHEGPQLVENVLEVH